MKENEDGIAELFQADYRPTVLDDDGRQKFGEDLRQRIAGRRRVRTVMAGVLILGALLLGYPWEEQNKPGAERPIAAVSASGLENDDWMADLEIIYGEVNDWPDSAGLGWVEGAREFSVFEDLNVLDHESEFTDPSNFDRQLGGEYAALGELMNLTEIQETL